MANEAMNIGAKGTNRLRPAIWSVAALLLLTPLVAMQFTREVNWDTTDFVVMGLMLAIACGAYELTTKLTGSRKTRIAIGMGIVVSFLLIWVELAVGIVGD